MMSRAYIKLLDQIQTDQYAFMRFEQIDIDQIIKLGSNISEKCDNVAIIGFGASSLNIRALLSCAGNYHKKILFLDSLDELEINQTIGSLNLERTVFFALSQSGNTHETYALTKYIVDEKKVNPKNIYVISPSENNLLLSLSQEINSNHIRHDGTNGRFSIISKSSLLPCSVIGLDVANIMQIAIETKQILIDNYFQDQILTTAGYYIDNLEKSRSILVSFNYVYQLKGLLKWKQQMLGESLGKRGMGITHIISRGTFDEHTQLQLYLDGQDDKFYEIINNTSSSLKLSADLKIHVTGTYDALIKNGRPVNMQNIKLLDERFVIQEIIKLVSLVIILGNHMSINTFDQPAVNFCKINYI